MIIAVDFDGTLVENDFPDIGKAISITQDFIRERIKEGDKVILWTCRTGEYLDKAIRYCKSVGINFDAVNNNLPEVVNEYEDNPRKVFADIYLDDRNATIVNDLGMVLFKGRLVGI